MVPHYPYTESELKASPDLKNSYYNVGSFMWFKKMGSSNSTASGSEGGGTGGSNYKK